MFGPGLVADAITAMLATRDPLPRFAADSIFLLGFVLLAFRCARSASCCKVARRRGAA